ncbi:putative protein OS=Streptomyces microflavus OX=1919 GN=Smic_85570 PE=4 SV=1 [Streptomyces microflavus]
MSNDVAYPVFRTSHLGLALSTARRLMEFGRREDSRVTAYAELCSVAEVQRVARELPQGQYAGDFDYREVGGVPREQWPLLVAGLAGRDLPTDPAVYEGRLPVKCELDHLPIGRIEDVFAAAIGPSRGWINWEWLCWPDAPELDFLGERKHAEVSLLFNTRTRELDEPADDHTVLLHVRSVCIDGRPVGADARTLACRAGGLTVIGPGELW